MGLRWLLLACLSCLSATGLPSKPGEEKGSAYGEETRLSAAKEAEALRAEISALRTAAVAAALKEESEAYHQEVRKAKSPEIKRKAMKMAEESRRQAERLSAESRRQASVALESRFVADIINGRANEGNERVLGKAADTAARRSEEVAAMSRAAAELAARKGSAALIVFNSLETDSKAKREAAEVLAKSKKEAFRYSSAASKAEAAASLLRSLLEEPGRGTADGEAGRENSTAGWLPDNAYPDYLHGIPMAIRLSSDVAANPPAKQNGLYYDVYDYDGGFQESQSYVILPKDLAN